jgi:hypothetical protein
MKHADIAMYYSKGRGRNKYTLYSSEMADNIQKDGD